MGNRFLMARYRPSEALLGQIFMQLWGLYDNIFVERLERGSVKYEEVYLHHYQTVSEARNGLAKYFLFYNME